MAHWDTRLFASMLGTIPEAKIQINGPGGDFDTEEIVVEKNGGTISVWGMNCFDPHQEMKNPKVSDCDLIFAGASERYGMEDAMPEDHILLGEIMQVLRPLVSQVETRGWKAWF